MYIVQIKTSPTSLETIAKFPTLIGAQSFIKIQQDYYKNSSIFFITTQKTQIIGHAISTIIGIVIGMFVLFILIMILA